MLRTSADRGVTFIEGDNQQSVTPRPEVRLVEQRPNTRLEPLVGLEQRAVVSIMLEIGNNQGVIRQLVSSHVLGKLGKGNHPALLLRAVDDVGIPSGRVVTHSVEAGIAAHPSHRGKGFGVHLPGAACSVQFSKNIVAGNGLRTTPSCAVELKLGTGGR